MVSNLTLLPTAADKESSSERTQRTEEDNTLDLLALVLAVWRRKWLVLMCAVLFGSVGWFYANKVATPLYTSTARLAFQVRSQQVVDVESVLSGVSTEQPAINTELEVIKSRRVIGLLVDALELTEDTEFNGLGDPSKYSIARLRLAVQEWRTGETFTRARPDPETLRLRTLLNVRNTIVVRPIRNTYLFDILVTTKDRRKSAELTNTLANLYISDQITAKFEATEYAVNWLSERAAELELEIDTIEGKLELLRAESELISLEALEALNIRMKGIRDRLDSAVTSRALAQKQSLFLDGLVERGNIEEIKAKLDDPIMERLRQSDSAVAILAHARALAEAARLDLDRTMAQENALKTSFEQLSEQIVEQNADLNAVNQLLRERDATTVLYETFLARLKETSIQAGLQQPDSRILSEAVLGTPVAPRKLRIQAGAVLIGMMVGATFVFLSQFLNTGFRTANSLESRTGLTVIGQLPRIKLRGRRGLIEFLSNSPTSAAAEANRNLRTSILLSNVDHPPRVIMSTSSIPGEGKTTQSISLAHNLAGLDKSVLLVEGDNRRLTFSEYFKKNGDGSLLKVVSGEMPLKEAVQKETVLGFDVLMGERSTVNAADFFSSERFIQFLKMVRDEYDFIIVDTPPVLVVPDARVIGQNVDTVIYSVKWDSTTEAQVQEGLHLLRSVGVKIGGLVLSQVDPRGMKRYGYGDQYGAYSGYGSNYYDKG